VLKKGDKFGKLTVIELVSGNNANNRRYRCQCECGGTKITSEGNLKRGRCKSCGCLYFGHGGSKKKNIYLGSDSRLYRIWGAMKNRCLGINKHKFKYYGGRGITVCNEWANSYNAFKKWALENGYDEQGGRNCTIERINVNGNYEPSNCRWATIKEQMNNTRRNTFVEYDGKRMSLSQWADYLKIGYSSFMSRWSRGWTMERIVNTPVRHHKEVVIHE
jgi:hypothetical protein